MKKLQQFNILAFNYNRLKNNNFKIETTLFEAERNDELIALADNECLRAIRRLTKHPFDDNGEQKVAELFEERRRLVKQKNSEWNRRRIAEINNTIRELLYIPEFISVTTEKKRSYPKIGRDGFFVNGKHYRRLMCSAAMARTNRAMFCADEIYDALDEIIRCGCKQTKIVPAKWNAYYSLISTATFRVSFPRVCVVKDYEIKMNKTVDWSEECEHQDTVARRDAELEFNIWDGMGLISPELAKVWSEEVGYGGIAETFIVRAPFVKGLVATFDIHSFSDKIAKNKTIIDAYGKEHNIDDIDIILTTSQFKLWDAYDSMESHQDFMRQYGVSWGVTRLGVPEEKKTIRTNYQFVQVLNLENDDIKNLCEPTVDWLNGVRGGDYNTKLFFLLGKMIKKYPAQELWNNIQDSAVKSLMLEPELINDSYLSDKLAQSLRKKIKEAYIGKLIVDGGFNTLVFDPYGLAEYALGMQPRGLLNEFEHYADFWSVKGKSEIIAMRSPLTWRAEVNKLNLKHTEEMQKWYKYLPNTIILNMWGNDRDIFSGADADGDEVATTSNETFLKCRYGGVPVLYEHKKANKEIIEK